MEKISKEEIVISCNYCENNYNHDEFKDLKYMCPCRENNKYQRPSYGWDNLRNHFKTKVIVTTEVSVPNSYIEPDEMDKKSLPYKCRSCDYTGRTWQFNSMGVCGHCMGTWI
jgi:hypothetical protein